MKPFRMFTNSVSKQEWALCLNIFPTYPRTRFQLDTITGRIYKTVFGQRTGNTMPTTSRYIRKLGPMVQN
jgi:hypothetical protein